MGRRYEVWGLHPTIRLPEFPPHLTILAVNTQQALRPARFVAGRQHAVIRCSFLVGARQAVPGANAWQRRAIQAARPRPQPAAVNRSLWSAAARRRCLPLGLAQACCTRWHARDAFHPRREFRGSEPQLRKKRRERRGQHRRNRWHECTGYRRLGGRSFSSDKKTQREAPTTALPLLQQVLDSAVVEVPTP